MPPVNIQMLGRMVAQKREKMGLGIRAAAKEIGVSPATLSRVERGFVPDLDTFSKVCKWLGVNPGDVLGTGSPRAQIPKVAVHFRKQAALAPATAQALAQMVMAAHRAWLATGVENP